jgi:DNA-binding MarR family transcriptional regulator
VSTSPPVVPEADSDACSTGGDACSAVTDDMGWSLGVIYRALLKAANAAASDVPGGQRGYHVLVGVAGGGPGTQLALAQQLGVDRTVMTYLLDDLEQAGLIERQPDPADRRARRVVITEAGRALHRTLQERMTQVAAHVLSGLDPAGQQAFLSTLHSAALHLANDDPPPGACTVAEEIQVSTQPTRATRRPRRTS